jgi:hypothetical protein
MSSQPQRPYSSSSSPQPYGTAIPIQGQPRAPQQGPVGPYGSGSGATPQPQRPMAPGTPYRPVQAGPNSMQGYSPSLARGYGQGTTQTPPSPQQEYARPPPQMGGYTPQQQQQLNAMRQMQPPQTTALEEYTQPPVAPAQMRPQPLRPREDPVPSPSPKTLRLERTFHPVRDPNAPWSIQGPQPTLGMAVQGTSLVFQQSGVIALYVSVQQAPPDMLLRLVNPLTQGVVAFAYGNESMAFLSVVKPVDAGEAWQLQTMVPLPEQGTDAPPPDLQPVSMVVQIARLA